MQKPIRALQHHGAGFNKVISTTRSFEHSKQHPTTTAYAGKSIKTFK